MKKYFYQKKLILFFLLGFLSTILTLYFQDVIHLFLEKYGISDFDFSLKHKKITFLSIDFPYTHVDTLSVYFYYRKPNIIDIYKIEIFGLKSTFFGDINKDSLQKILKNIKKYFENKFNSSNHKKFPLPIKIIFHPKVFVYDSYITTPKYKVKINNLVINDLKEKSGKGKISLILKKYNLALNSKAEFNWEKGYLNLKADVYFFDKLIGYFYTKIKENNFLFKGFLEKIDYKILSYIPELKKYYVKLKEKNIDDLKIKNIDLDINIKNISNFNLPFKKYTLYATCLLDLNSNYLKLKNEKIKLSLSPEKNFLVFQGKNIKVNSKNIYYHIGEVATKDFQVLNLKGKIYPSSKKNYIKLEGKYYPKVFLGKLKLYAKNQEPIKKFLENIPIKFNNLIVNSQIDFLSLETVSRVSLEKLKYKKYPFYNISLKTLFDYKSKLLQGLGKIQNPNLKINGFLYNLKNQTLKANILFSENYKKLEEFLKNLNISLPFKTRTFVTSQINISSNFKEKKYSLKFSLTNKNFNITYKNYTIPIDNLYTFGNISRSNNKTKVNIYGNGTLKNFTLFENNFPISILKSRITFSYTYPEKIFNLKSKLLAYITKLNYTFLGNLNFNYKKILKIDLLEDNKNTKISLLKQNDVLAFKGKIKKLNYQDYILNSLAFSGNYLLNKNPNINLEGYLHSISKKTWKNLILKDINFTYNKNLFENYLEVLNSEIFYQNTAGKLKLRYDLNSNKINGILKGSIHKENLKPILGKYIKNIGNFSLNYKSLFTYDFKSQKLHTSSKIKRCYVKANLNILKKLNLKPDILNIYLEPSYISFDILQKNATKIFIPKFISIKLNLKSQNRYFKNAYLKLETKKLLLNIDSLRYKNKNLNLDTDMKIDSQNYLGYLNKLKKISKFLTFKVSNPNINVNVNINKLIYSFEGKNNKSSVDLRQLYNYLSKYNISLSLISKNLVKIKGSLFEIYGELEGNLPENNVITLKNLSGSFNLLGYKFIILTGEIKFNVLNKTGNINLIASTKKDDFSIFCIVSGSLKNPQVTFISYPYLPQNEILSLLLGFKSIEGNYIEYQTKYFSIKPKFSENVGFEDYVISLYIPISSKLIFEYSRLLGGYTLGYNIKYKLTKNIFILSSLKKEEDINVMELGIGIEKNIW